jgi:hypothetical protein
MTRLNKDFHFKFQPLGFTAHRIKYGMACETSTYKDYLNLQSFLRYDKVPFNLFTANDCKPYKVVIKGIPPPLRMKLHALGLAVQNVIPMTVWRVVQTFFLFIVSPAIPNSIQTAV